MEYERYTVASLRSGSGKDACFPGIYCIRHIASGRVYVGSSRNIKARWRAHISRASRGIQHSRALQNYWNKYGEDGFIFYVLEYAVDMNTILDIEQVWMDRLRSHNRKFGLNIRPKALSSLGVKHSSQSLANMSKSQKIVQNRPELRAKQSDTAKSRGISPENRAKMTDGKRRSTVQVSLETRTKMSNSLKIAFSHPIVRTRLSDAQKLRAQDPLEKPRRSLRAKLGWEKRKAKSVTAP